MIHAFIRLFLGVGLACTLILTGVYALAAERSEAIRDFFQPPDCAAPCFLGLRVGATGFEEAQVILAAHPWIRDVRANDQQTAITWRWNGSQPSFVSRFDSDQFVGRVVFEGKTVSEIYLVTGARWGDVLGTLGVPDWVSAITRVASTRVLYVQTAAYSHAGMAVEATIRCPIGRAQRLWFAYTTVHFPAPSSALQEDIYGDGWGC